MLVTLKLQQTKYKSTKIKLNPDPQFTSLNQRSSDWSSVTASSGRGLLQCYLLSFMQQVAERTLLSQLL